MALTTGTSAPRALRPNDSGLPPYYKRLEPLAGGYNLARDDGRPIGRIRVFDDRTDGETGIHVQFSQGAGYGGGKIAVMHFDALEGYDEMIDALTQAREQMRVANRKP